MINIPNIIYAILYLLFIYPLIKLGWFGLVLLPIIGLIIVPTILSILLYIIIKAIVKLKKSKEA
ncbi:MAG: hypothetical protein DRP01_01650 [Archaeoglobales archaeon]|nr:MAG: hypothetical protein DRP01_01650 [Archaeoglobales archaeon]